MAELDTSDVQIPSVSLKRVPELWFDDGNLVLQAGSSLFRVYGRFLAQHSPIFNDMLKIPQPQGEQLVEGCPVVQLADNEGDLECFLRSLFDYRFFPPFPSRTTFDNLSGILRLATKYMVDPLRQRALVHLSSAFPLVLSEYPGWAAKASWSIDDAQYIRLILLAREMSVDWILPLVLYRACNTLTPVQFLHGIYHGDTYLELSSADKLAYLQQFPLIRENGCAEVLDFLWNPAQILGCVNGRNGYCNRSRTDLRMSAEAWREENPLPLLLWNQGDWKSLTVCESCLAAMKEAHATALQKFWDGLPGRFGFPGWPELQKMKEDALV
ncbi:hypothetical protein B0H10DRAFT_2082251 [Mycena sp. CBHHK59/15]|nr:hypothetical protein B0H10DRAFT_2082251 [Mycena sp. CBHHK59/15]